jgi:tetratricopeptide (TPR) repeat protein
MDRLDEAVDKFRKVLTLGQERMENYSNLAMALSKQGVALRKQCRDPGDASIPKVRQAREKFAQAIQMFEHALTFAPNNVILHSNRGLACFFGNHVEEAMQEWSRVSQLDPEYARRRGHLMQTVFDEAAVQFVSMKVAERLNKHPLPTASFVYKLAPSYDVDRWEVVISDAELKSVPAWSQEADRLERNLKALMR